MSKRWIFSLALSILGLALVSCTSSQNLDASGPQNGTGGTTGAPDPGYACGATHPYKQQQIFYPGQLPFHATGSWWGNDWKVGPAFPAGLITFGPYTPDVPLGVNLVLYNFEIDNTSADNNQVLSLDIYSNALNTTRLAVRDVYRSEFLQPNAAQSFALAFDNPGGCDLEFRSAYKGLGAISHHSTTVVRPQVSAPVAFNFPAGAAFEDYLVVSHTQLTLGAWFRTTRSGVLFGAQDVPYPQPVTRNWTPSMYIGTDGKLHGIFWETATNPVTSQIVSPAAVNDGSWHFAVQVGAGNTQSLYLDGQLLGSVAGPINQQGMSFNQVGNGFTQSWPATPGGWFPYQGDLGHVFIEKRAWSASDVTAAYGATKGE